MSNIIINPYSFAKGFEGTIIEQDDFTGTTINTGKWTVTNPYGVISQNNDLTLTTDNASSTNRVTGDNLTSINTANRDIITARCDFNWSGGLSIDHFISFGLWRDSNNFIYLENGYNSNNYAFVIEQGGSLRYNPVSSIERGKSIKVTYNTANNEIKFWYWDSAWIQMGTTQTWDVRGAGVLQARILGNNYATSGSGTPIIGTIDNLYMTIGDYETLTP